MGSGQNINIVDICLIEIFPLISLHLDIFRLSYGLFAKTGRVAYVQQIMGSLVLDSFVT